MVSTSPSNKNKANSNASKSSRNAAASVARPKQSPPALKNDVPNAKLRAAIAEADEMFACIGRVTIATNNFEANSSK